MLRPKTLRRHGFVICAPSGALALIFQTVSCRDLPSEDTVKRELRAQDACRVVPGEQRGHTGDDAKTR